MFHSIVVPVDLAEVDLARPAIEHAAQLVRESGGRMTLVNVVPIMPVMMMDTVPVSYEAEIAEKAKASLADLAATVDLPRSQIGTTVRIGGIQHEILAVVKEERADLILLGSHEPHLSTYLLGCNASAIVRHAHCSVLVLRERPEQVGGHEIPAAKLGTAMPATGLPVS
ncbi:universal stress protein [Labrys wisconsinensis]|uniref:Nucleotide-binding universal stress UspA family protein n=1 Tax=Labrys wisconsinensis TaxID=425677 RepID=A0ABU0JFI4_9HYPH|nr:universal stress protein [Labrys wisconsinensis]MDQ0473043.1 nucleotide-binding universal stress UspA family protein [Labrys wisconsinensis]